MEKDTKKYLFIGGTLLLGVGGYVAYKKIKNRADTKAAVKRVTKGNNKDLGINIPSLAAQIGIDLGTAFSSFDPRSWSENDDKVKVSVLKVPKPLIPTLINEYAKNPDTKGRNLIADLQKKLDDWDEVKYLFV